MRGERTSDQALPPLYRTWMDQLLAAPIHAEPLAECNNCPMIAERPRTKLDVSFLPETKCCTYCPDLPSFLVGAILADPQTGPDARRALEERIRLKSAVTPLGVGLATSRWETYKTLTTDGEFGRRVEYRCPHFVERTGGCGIWQYRNAVCSTWFCRHQRGHTGERFWEALCRLLKTVEQAVSTWCALELGLDDVALSIVYPVKRTQDWKVLDTTMDALAADRVDAGLYECAWGRFAGREREFYRECAERVADLAWDRVVEIGGAELRMLSQLVAAEQRKVLDNELPVWVKIGSHHATGMSSHRVRVRGYSRYHLYDLPADLPAVISTVALRSPGSMKLEELVKAANEIRPDPVDPDLQRVLVESGFLVPAFPRRG